MLRGWGLDPAARGRRTVMPHSGGDGTPNELFDSRDYPVLALRYDRGGIIAARLMVDAAGAVTKYTGDQRLLRGAGDAAAHLSRPEQGSVSAGHDRGWRSGARLCLLTFRLGMEP